MNTLLYSLWHGSKQPPNIILRNFLPCLTHILCQFMKISGWRLVWPYTSSHALWMTNQGTEQANQGSVHSLRHFLCELQCEVLHYPAGISHLEPWSWRVWQQGLPFLPHTGRHSVSLQQVPNVSCCHIQYLPHDSRSLSMHIDNHCFLWPSTRSSMDMLVSIWLTPKRMEARLITQYHTMPFSVPVDYGSAPCKFLLSVVWCKQ